MMASLLARAVAAYGLPGEWRLPDRPLAGQDWNALLEEVREHRLAGLLMRAVQDGSFAVNQQQREQIVDAFRNARYYTVALQAQDCWTARILNSGY